jgi:alkanesulfonate monooxygenase SsuD/methylene tetrahydromethanopterin reductase-like flavin-dependent oxidoreductase (luciferase family)
MRRLWTEERVSFAGEYYLTSNATIYDRQRVPVPIYIAASGPTKRSALSRSPIPTASRSFQETSSISTKRQGWRLCADGAQVAARSNCSVSDGLILPPT